MNHLSNRILCMSGQSKHCPSKGIFGIGTEVDFLEEESDFCPCSPSSPSNFIGWWKSVNFCLSTPHCAPFRATCRSRQKSIDCMDCMDCLDKPLSMRLPRGCLKNLLGQCSDTWTENRQFALVWGGAP